MAEQAAEATAAVAAAEGVAKAAGLQVLRYSGTVRQFDLEKSYLATVMAERIAGEDSVGWEVLDPLKRVRGCLVDCYPYLGDTTG